MDNNFTEATPWQYRHYAPHDIKGLTNLLGGRDSLAKSLDALFEADTAILGKRLPDVTGRLGQYAHGNEPSHGTAFLYAYSSEPWKTSALTKKILACFYQNTPSGAGMTTVDKCLPGMYLLLSVCIRCVRVVMNLS